MSLRRDDLLFDLDEYQLCPECCGDCQIERIKGFPNRDGGVVELRDCELCDGSGFIARMDNGD